MEILSKFPKERLEEVLKVLGKGFKTLFNESINGVFEKAKIKVKIDLSRKDQTDDDAKYHGHIRTTVKELNARIQDEKMKFLKSSHALQCLSDSTKGFFFEEENKSDIASIYREYKKSKPELSRSFEELAEESINDYSTYAEELSDTDDELVDEGNHIGRNKEMPKLIREGKHSFKRSKIGESQCRSIRIQLNFSTPKLKEVMELFKKFFSSIDLALLTSDIFVDIARHFSDIYIFDLNLI